jgi:hypothetical protein
MPTHPRRRRWALVVAVVSAAGLVASSCSSSTDHAAADTTAPISQDHDSTLAAELARARLATARYVTDLDAARADGYRIITPMMPEMGYHFLNPSVEGFAIDKPAILVYEHHDDTWQLAALEWVFPQQPATPPLEGASYGTFGAACHYDDGTFTFSAAQTDCAPTSPDTGSRFVFWHPDLVTLHVWIWYPNPDGLFASMDPLIEPFDAPPSQGGSGGSARSLTAV